MVPCMAFPDVSLTFRPLPSSSPHLATMPVFAVLILLLISDLIWAWVLAKFHILTSSILPLKKPWVAPVDVCAEPSAECCMLRFWHGWLTASVVSRLPFRYSF